MNIRVGPTDGTTAARVTDESGVTHAALDGHSGSLHNRPSRPMVVLPQSARSGQSLLDEPSKLTHRDASGAADVYRYELTRVKQVVNRSPAECQILSGFENRQEASVIRPFDLDHRHDLDRRLLSWQSIDALVWCLLLPRHWARWVADAQSGGVMLLLPPADAAARNISTVTWRRMPNVATPHSVRSTIGCVVADQTTCRLGCGPCTAVAVVGRMGEVVAAGFISRRELIGSFATAP